MTRFEWDERKNRENQVKHSVSFTEAQAAFFDPSCVIAVDEENSREEPRYHCFGRVGDGVLTVRFTYREGRIRIIGAGYWRKGRALYEEENRLHG